MDLDMKSKILSRRDIDFMLFEWLETEKLCTRKNFESHSVETFSSFLNLAQTISENNFAPHNAMSDAHEPSFDGLNVSMIPEIGEALKIFNQSGLLAATLDEDLNGVNLPETIYSACFTWFQAANIATSSYSMLTKGAVNLLIEHGSKEQILKFVSPMTDGRFFGTMCLSEPQAGSSLIDINMKARTDGGTQYRLFGNKMWISGGEHSLSENIVHLVLARIEGAPKGVKGLSLFIVPKLLVNDDATLGERNDVVLAGLNHKMGYRGTTNAVLNFGEGAFMPEGSPGAIAYLVGAENQGLDHMFHMMNEARIAVGAGAVALGYTSYLHALEYAHSRLQGRSLANKEASSSQVPIISHPDVRRMLLASKTYVEGGLALVLYSARLLDDQKSGETQEIRDQAKELLDILTPIVKSWPSQWCLKANDLAIQIHGGYGYTRDYPLEQFYRDNRLNPIHEGTHGIHGLDLLGRRVLAHEGKSFSLLLAVIRATIRSSEGEFIDRAQFLYEIIERIESVTKKLWATGESARALANSSLYLEVFGHAIIAWLWLEQVKSCQQKTGDFYRGKEMAGRYFFDFELPQVLPNLVILERRDLTLLELDEKWF
jgi:alkylation response protein AidB-like acyl-CoA dehydrogenase